MHDSTTNERNQSAETIIEIMKQWGISLFDDSQDLENLAQEVEQAEFKLNQKIY